MQREDYSALGQRIESFLEEKAGGRLGFCLLVFSFDAPGISNYLSNAERADMVTALRETADRLERGEDNPR